jgi:glycosyltransferase involved in cell wall biosynthesis
MLYSVCGRPRCGRRPGSHSPDGKFALLAMPDANSRDLDMLTPVRTDTAAHPAQRIAVQNKMKAKRRRVLLVQTQAENAGAQEISRLAGAGLTELGYEVHHLFFFRKSDSFDAPPNTIYCWPRRPGNAWTLLQFLWQLGRQIRNVQPDVVLTFQHFGNVIGGAVSRLVSRAPVIANQVSSALSMSWPVRAADIAMGSAGFFRFITLNSHQMEREYASYPASYRSRMKYVAHGFDDKALNIPKQEARRRLDLPENGILLGCTARLHPNKRLDAAIRLLAGAPSWHLALAGQGQDEARLRLLAAELAVSERLHFVGELSPRRVGQFLACLDVFVFPSEAETFGLAAVEAASAGIPCVVTDLPVLREVLSPDGKPAALFVDASDNAALSAAVSRVLDNAPLREALRANAGVLKQHYSLKAMVDAYVELVEAA